MTDHPTEADLWDLALGWTEDTDLVDHVGTCEACAAVLEAIEAELEDQDYALAPDPFDYPWQPTVTVKPHPRYL